MRRHWGPVAFKAQPLVMWKDLLNGNLRGLDTLMTSKRGYACVFPQTAETPIWIPDRLIGPFHQKTSMVNPEKKEAKEDKRSHEENEDA